MNVPVDEVPSESVAISGMSEQLLAKAESLGWFLFTVVLLVTTD